MSPIITTLLTIIQAQQKQIYWLMNFICQYIPLRQWAHDEANSPKYQKLQVDKLPLIGFPKHDWNWRDLLNYYKDRYDKVLKPVNRRTTCNIPETTKCPRCSAPMPYLYENSGSKGQLLCKVCNTLFVSSVNRYDKHMNLRCPHCTNTLSPIKNRKFFIIHKCVNKRCAFYLRNLKKIASSDRNQRGKSKYKLHYIYREFTVDFFRMDLDSLPKNASSLRFARHNAYIMSLCLTMHVNLQLSLRKTSQALYDLYGIKVSHQQVANYAKTASVVIKPFVDHFDYKRSDIFVADETYIKVRGVKGYVWFIIDAFSRSILGYQVSDNRGVGPCILAIRMAFRGLKKLNHTFRFVADGYTAYPLAAQQFFLEFGNDFKFNITQVIGLTNDDQVSKEFRPFKQMIERLNRTFKASYRNYAGFDNFEGAHYSVSLWVAYYNFLRPHKHTHFKPLNYVDELVHAGNMPAKWQMLIFLGQQAIIQLQQHSTS